MIKGIPNGWEVVEFRYACEGEYFLSNAGKIERWVLGRKSDCVLPIIRKIVKPKKYRPFANAAEFRPHRERWMTHPENTVVGEFQVVEFNDIGIWCNGMKKLMPYKTAFEIGLRFDDGTPFGIEVTE